jgi:uncharacterized membrane protein YeaQ/YmgE (transglycosylase-associated protein family)
MKLYAYWKESTKLLTFPMTFQCYSVICTAPSSAELEQSRWNCKTEFTRLKFRNKSVWLTATGRLTDWMLAGWLTGWLTDWLTDRLTDWLAGWMLADWLTDWLAGWLAGWLTDWLTDWLTGWLTDWLADWLTGWLTDWLTDWLAGWLTDWLNAGSLTDRLTDWLADWQTDWLADWLTDWLADWQTDWLNAGWLTDSLADWQTDWLTDWLNAGWLTDWLAECWLTDWLADWQADWLNEWMNEKLTAKSIILLDNPTVAQLVTKFLSWMFVACYSQPSPLSWDRWFIQHLSVIFFIILLNIILPSTSSTSKWHPYLRFSPPHPVHIFFPKSLLLARSIRST